MTKLLSILTLTATVAVLGACSVTRIPIGPSVRDMIEAPVGNSDPVPTIPTPVCDPPHNGDICPGDTTTTTTIPIPVDCSNSNSDPCHPIIGSNGD
jgi:hypothetical protein